MQDILDWILAQWRWLAGYADTAREAVEEWVPGLLKPLVALLPD